MTQEDKYQRDMLHEKKRNKSMFYFRILPGCLENINKFWNLTAIALILFSLCPLGKSIDLSFILK